MNPDFTKRAQEVGFERAALEAGAVVAGRGVPAGFRPLKSEWL